MTRTFLNGKVTLHGGDCRDVLKSIPDASIDSVVTDPPYALVSIQKRFGKPGSAAVKVPEGGSGAYARASAGFMGKQWDTGETAFCDQFWSEVLRVLKPGGHVAAFSGTRTYHRMAVAIEDAGFEIRDQIGWAFGSGFPKSHNIGNGFGTALKPAWEPICLARKPLIGTVANNVLEHGTGALNIDGCRIEAQGRPNREVTGDLSGGVTFRASGGGGSKAVGTTDQGRWPANLIHDGSDEVVALFPEPHGAGAPRAASEGTHSGNTGMFYVGGPAMRFGDSGSAARFFYTAKADAYDRLGSKHPTVKPIDLMQWLCRLITPPGGVVLDPFAGTGTTGEAVWREGMRAILIEREDEYQADIVRRMELAANPSKRAAVAATKNQIDDLGPLFAGLSEAAE
jgi:site-specific DNA-methyltransferase (adenine-specific)